MPTNKAKRHRADFGSLFLLLDDGLWSALDLVKLVCYQTLFCQIPRDILTNLGCIWGTFKRTKYKKMSQNTTRYLAESV